MTGGFTFGVVARRPLTDRASWAATIRRADDLGFDTLYLSDHLDDRPAPWAGLAAAAGVSTRLRLGHLVLANDLRHPLTVAAEGATLDVLSDGRFELGLGTGWRRADYDALGLALDPAARRIERLDEALHLVRRAWRGEPGAARGTHYDVPELPALVRPVQRPHPPILVGAGSRRMLALAGRHASVVNLMPWPHRTGAAGGPRRAPSPAAIDARIATVRDTAGDRADRVRLGVTAYGLDVRDRRTRPPDDDPVWATLTGTPWAYRGSARTVADELRGHRERYGVTHVVVYDQVMDSAGSVLEELRGT